MNTTERRSLQTNHVNLVNNLEAVNVLDDLQEDGILTENDCELITNGKTRKERNRHLLAILPTRGPSAFKSFKRALCKGKYFHLLELLNSVNMTDSPNTEHSSFVFEWRHTSDRHTLLRIISKCKNKALQKCLETHFHIFIDNIEVHDILDYFYQEQLISEEHIELIKSGKTRKERCVMFFDELSTCTSETILEVLKMSLEKKYKYINDILQTTSLEINKRDVHEKRITTLNDTHTNLEKFFKSCRYKQSNMYLGNVEAVSLSGNTRRPCEHKTFSLSDNTRQPCEHETITLCGNTHAPCEIETILLCDNTHGPCAHETISPCGNTHGPCEHETISLCDNTHGPCAYETFSLCGNRHGPCDHEKVSLCGNSHEPFEHETVSLCDNSHGLCEHETVSLWGNAHRPCQHKTISLRDNTHGLCEHETFSLCGNSHDQCEHETISLCNNTHGPCEHETFSLCDNSHGPCEHETISLCDNTHGPCEYKTFSLCGNTHGPSVHENYSLWGNAHGPCEHETISLSINTNGPCEHEDHLLLGNVHGPCAHKTISLCDNTHGPCKNNTHGACEHEEFLSSDNTHNPCEHEIISLCGNTHGRCEHETFSLSDDTCESCKHETVSLYDNIRGPCEHVAFLLTDNTHGPSEREALCDNIHESDIIQIRTYHRAMNETKRERKQRPVIAMMDSSSETESDLPQRTKLERRKRETAYSIVSRNHPISNIRLYRPVFTTQNFYNRRFMMTFNHLSTTINGGNFDKFDLLYSSLQEKYSNDFDMKYLLEYLHASRDLFKTDFVSAKKHIAKAFQMVPKTSNPKYFTLELLTTKTRMYITQKKLEKLEQTLDDAKMVIEVDPVGCTGRAAGWLYLNDARNCTAQIGLLNVRHSNVKKLYSKLHVRAKESFKKALSNFERDNGNDGPFGFGYALCRLAILLLQCDESGRTVDIFSPSEEDILEAHGYLIKLKDSFTELPKILKMHYSLAKSDYYLRRKNTIKALKYAEEAFEITSELQLMEFINHVNNRCIYLRTKTPQIVINDIKGK